MRARGKCAKIAHMADLDAAKLGERIRDARDRAGVSQEDLGEAVGLERSVVSKIEKGIRKVTALELSDIASAIGVRMSAFFEEPLPALVSHRSSQGLDPTDSKIDALLAKFASEAEFVGSLEAVELGSEMGVPTGEWPLARPVNDREAEMLAANVRRLLSLDADEPVKNLVDSVATIGLLAFSHDVGPDTADAGTILLRHGGVSLVNSHMKVGRRRLALAHELGHYVIADEYTVDWRVDDHSTDAVSLESRLDRFARALLLPAGVVTTTWRERSGRNGDRAAAIWLASEFRVDMATLATRLKELELADRETVAAVRKIQTTRADIIEMNLYVPNEELQGTTVPKPFALAVLHLARDERISRERALDLLQGTFEDDDLLPVRQRREDEIWTFVS